jgi:hypothetical protein
LPIAGLINDDNGNIWFYTDRSIHELNIVTGQIKTMSEIDGFEKQNFELLPWPNKVQTVIPSCGLIIKAFHRFFIKYFHGEINFSHLI